MYIHGPRSRRCSCTQAKAAELKPCPSFNEAKLEQDYAATGSDASVLKRPLKEELHAHGVKSVFGYSRTLREG